MTIPITATVNAVTFKDHKSMPSLISKIALRIEPSDKLQLWFSSRDTLQRLLDNPSSSVPNVSRLDGVDVVEHAAVPSDELWLVNTNVMVGSQIKAQWKIKP